MSEKQRGLGRGLSALLGDNDVSSTLKEAEPARVAAPESKDNRSEKPIELLIRNPDQPRRVFNEADILELSESIKIRGLLQPILVRPAPGQTGKYQIIAGERRWRAAQMAGLHQVPVVIRELNDLEALEIGLIENVQRTDLNPMEEARAYHVLSERFGNTQDTIAKSVSKSRSHIANLMRLLSLPEHLQDMVLQNQISAGHARALLTADNPEGLAQRIINEGLSVRETEALAKAPAALTYVNRPKPYRSADLEALERSLSEALGLKIGLTEKGEGGEIKISYRTLDQLEAVCEKLLKP